MAIKDEVVIKIKDLRYMVILAKSQDIVEREELREMLEKLERQHSWNLDENRV